MVKKKTIQIVFIAVFLAFIFGLSGWVLFRTPDKISESERRPLDGPPKLTWETFMNGTFFTAGEDYLLDQFPVRDTWRALRAYATLYLFGQSDNHDIVIKDGHAAEILDKLGDKSVETYIQRINMIFNRYLSKKDVNVYTTIIPDKMYYMAGMVGAPSIDYAALAKELEEALPGEYIEIFDTLELDSYYKTDTHWSQDKIVGTADKLLAAMGMPVNEGTYVKETVGLFRGVYYGRSALALTPDYMNTIGSPVIDKATSLWADNRTGKLIPNQVYKNENINANDPYDVFVSGASTIYVLDNPDIENGKTLYMFSDSFGRSLLPLLMSEYDKVVMLDVRYNKASLLLRIMPIEDGSDVLFAYSTTTINASKDLQAD